MIIKGQARGRARQLAAHLLRADQNERIHLYECRGTLAQDVEGALIELEARGVAARTQRPLYHASISPEAATPLKDSEVKQAVDLLEERLSLHGQPRVIVLHRKKERDHVHIVWSRIEPQTGTAIPYSWNYRLHETAARELEAMFGHRRIESSQGSRRRNGARRTVRDHEQRQAERSNIPLASVSAELTTLWHASRDSTEFRRKLEEAGYTLARGDRRVFVVIDKTGGVHSLARRIRGADTAMVRAQLAPVDLHGLPSVAEARERHLATKSRAPRASHFVAAAMEVTQPASLLAGRRFLPRSRLQTIRDAGRAIAEITRLHQAPSAPAKPLRIRRGSGRRSAPASYRTARSILIAEYASKVAAARCHAPRDELDATLAALYAEREAALRALAQRLGGEAAASRRSASYLRPRSCRSRRTRFLSKTRRKQLRPPPLR